MADRRLTVQFAGKDAGLGRSAKDAADQIGGVDRAADAAGKSLGSAAQSAGPFGSVLQGIGQGLGQAVASAAGQAVGAIRDLGAAVLEAGADFDAARAKAATLSDDVEGLAAAALETSNKLGNQASQTELLAASYDVLSAGFSDTADVQQILDASLQGAVGGFSDVATVSDALTSVMNAYGLSADSAASLTDKFVETQNKGKITVDEYAQNIGKLAPIAAQAGVSIDELNGFIATATASGVAVESTFSGLRGAYSAILKPSGEAAELAEKLGIEFNAQALSTKGLSGILEELNAKGADTPEILTQLFGSVEAVAAVAPSAGDGLATLRENMDASVNSAGTAAEAFDIVSNSIEGLQAGIQNQLTNALTAAGDSLDPVVQGVLKSVMSVFQGVGEEFGGFDPIIAAGERLQEALEENPELVQALVAVLSQLADTAVNLAAGAIDMFSGAVEGGGDLFARLGDNAAMFIQTFESTVSVISGVVATLVAIVAPVVQTILDIQSVVVTVVSGIASSIANLVGQIKGLFDDLFGGLDVGAETDAAGAALDQFAAILSSIATVAIDLVAGALASLREWLAENPELVERLQTVIGKLSEAFGKVAEIGRVLIGAVFSVLVDLFSRATEETGVLSKVFDTLGPVLNFVLGLLEKFLDVTLAVLGAAVEAVTRFVNSFELVRNAISRTKAELTDIKGIGIENLGDTAKGTADALGVMGDRLADTGDAAEGLGDQAQAGAAEFVDAAELEKQALEDLKETSDATAAQIQSNQQAQTLAVRESQAAGTIGAAEAAAQIKEIEQQSLAETLALKQQELEQVAQLRAAGAISAETAEGMERTLRAETGRLAIQIQEAEIAAAEAAAKAIRDAKIAALDEELEAAKVASQERIALLDQEQAVIEQQQAFLAAQQSLQGALGELEQARLENAIAVAEAAGEQAEADELRNQSAALAAEQEEAAFEAQLRAFDLSTQAQQLELERAIALAEIAELEAQIAIEKARANGASEAEIQNLERIADLRAQSTDRAREQVGAQEEIVQLQRQEIEVQQETARTQRDTATIQAETQATEAASGGTQGGGGGRGGGASRGGGGGGEDRNEEINRRFQQFALSKVPREEGQTALQQALSTPESVGAIISASNDLLSATISGQVQGGDAGFEEFLDANEFEEGGEAAGVEIEEAIVRGGERVAGIFQDSIRPSAIQSLRVGGAVDAGGLYQVHKDEFFVPSQKGTILNQRDSRALVRESLLNTPITTATAIPSAVSTAALEAKLDALIRQGGKLVSAPQNNTFVNEPDPYGKAAELRMAEIRRQVRGV